MDFVIGNRGIENRRARRSRDQHPEEIARDIVIGELIVRCGDRNSDLNTGRWERKGVRLLLQQCSLTPFRSPSPVDGLGDLDEFTVTGTPTPEEAAIFAGGWNDGKNNTIDVYYVNRLSDGSCGEAFANSGNPQLIVGAQAQGAGLIGTTCTRALEPFVLPHEIMHILINEGHPAPATNLASVQFNAGTTVGAGKRIGPYGNPIIRAGKTVLTRGHAEALPLMVADSRMPGQNAQEADLTPELLEPIVEQAIALWRDTGIDNQHLAALERANIYIDNLPSGFLGETYFSSTIVLDADAAGFGWFIDVTPQAHKEFVEIFGGELRAEETTDAFNRIDLLSTVVHEFGHVLGLPDLDPAQQANTIMTGNLDLGVRRLPGSAEASIVWNGGASPGEVSRVDGQVSEEVLVAAAGISIDEAPLKFIVSTTRRARNHTRPQGLLAMRVIESERRRDEFFRHQYTTTALVSDGNYFQTVTRYYDLLFVPKRRGQSNNSLVDLAFREFVDGSFGSLLESKCGRRQ